MATDAQIQANRENAKKSTGPRTPEGKAHVSKNALKHGLLAQDSVIPGEDPAEFDRHLTLYQDTYNPANYVERELVLQIADSAWRMRRLSRIEATVMTAGIERTRVHQETYRPERMREGHEGELQLLGASMLSRTLRLFAGLAIRPPPPNSGGDRRKLAAKRAAPIDQKCYLCAWTKVLPTSRSAHHG